MPAFLAAKVVPPLARAAGAAESGTASLSAAAKTGRGVQPPSVRAGERMRDATRPSAPKGARIAVLRTEIA